MAVAGADRLPGGCASRDAEARYYSVWQRVAYSGATPNRVSGYRKLVPRYRFSVPPSPSSVAPDRFLDDSGAVSNPYPQGHAAWTFGFAAVVTARVLAHPETACSVNLLIRNSPLGQRLVAHRKHAVQATECCEHRPFGQRAVAARVCQTW
jgi:hypothetical protein